MAGQQIHTCFIIVILSENNTLAAAERFPISTLAFLSFRPRIWEEFALRGRQDENGSVVERAVNLRAGWLERTLAGLDGFARRRGRSSIAAHLATGIQGEDAVFFFLRRKGYIVVARRWSSGDRPGDVDLIAWQGPKLCFIEVKTRTARDTTPAEVAVDRHKRYTLRRLATRYVRQLPHSERPPVRFDVISVYLVPGKEREFVHFENAFGWEERREQG
jgi:putative endonuclease